MALLKSSFKYQGTAQLQTMVRLLQNRRSVRFCPTERRVNGMESAFVKAPSFEISTLVKSGRSQVYELRRIGSTLLIRPVGVGVEAETHGLTHLPT